MRQGRIASGAGVMAVVAALGMAGAAPAFADTSAWEELTITDDASIALSNVDSGAEATATALALLDTWEAYVTYDDSDQLIGFATTDGTRQSTYTYASAGAGTDALLTATGDVPAGTQPWNYVGALDEAGARALADELAATDLSTADLSFVETETGGSIDFAVVPAGIYLVTLDGSLPLIVSTGAQVDADGLTVTFSAAAEPKQELETTLTKAHAFKDAAGYSDTTGATWLGTETVTYTLTSSVPVTTGIATPTFVIEDQLPAAVFVDPASVTVTIGGTDVTAQVVVTTADDATWFTTDSIEFDLSAIIGSQTAGDAIVITYDAWPIGEVTDPADPNPTVTFGDAGNTNVATLTYSTSATETDQLVAEDTFWTTQITLGKFDQDGNALPGAQFQVVRTANAGSATVELANAAADEASSQNQLTISALNAGEYCFIETVTPDGYVAAAAPACVTISFDAVTKQFAISIADQDGPLALISSSGGVFGLGFVNEEDVFHGGLPGTGGQILTVLAVLVVLAGGGYVVGKVRRNRADAAA